MSGSSEFRGVIGCTLKESAPGRDIGRDSGSPITEDYKAPFPFSGCIRRIIIKVPEFIPPVEQQEIQNAEAQSEMSRRQNRGSGRGIYEMMQKRD